MQRPRRPWLSLLVLCLGTFAILLDTTIVNVALPSLITHLSPRPALTRPPGRRLGPFRLPQPTDNRKGSPL